MKNIDDNRAAVANTDQADKDGDGTGDVCDNCPSTHDPGVWDNDGDGIGDACDDDSSPPLNGSCVDRFGSAPDFSLCEETETTCSFNVFTNGGTCEQICRNFGSECVEALDNEGSSCTVIPGSNDTCQTPRQDEICVCARAGEAPPPPPAANCTDLFGAVPGFSLCGETAASCRFNAITGGGSCEEICSRSGARCLAAFDNEGSSCAIIPGSNDTCQTRRQTELCECER